MLPIEVDTKGRSTTRSAQLTLVALLWLSLAPASFAQNNATPDLPSSRPLDAPALSQPDDPSGTEPLVQLEPQHAEPEKATSPPRVFVSSIEIRGNTVLPQSELAAIARGFVDRFLEGNDLEVLRSKITQHYRDAGYVGSGALLPDQDFEAGRLVVMIVEARLGDIALRGLHGYKAEVLRARIAGEPDEVLNVGALERRLQLLRGERYIRALHAQLRLASAPGVLHLEVEVVEARRYGGSLDISNYQPTTIGAANVQMGFSYANVGGWGDTLSANTGLSEGVTSVGAQYSVPVNRYDTRLDLRLRYAATEIVDSEFEGLDIESRYIASSVSLAHPLYRTPSSRLEIGVIGEWRQSRTTLDGFAFDIADAASDGRVRTSVLRFFQDFVHRVPDEVFALRSTVSAGFEVLGARSRVVEPADFVVWLGQAQWIRRLDPTGIELFARGNVQLALDPLVPFERFSVGGRYSVRGHRQNQQVSDNGYTASLESRFPLLRAPNGRVELQLVPFADVGRGWSRGRGGEPDGKTLAAAGIGLIWHPTRWTSAEFFYGNDFLGTADGSSDKPQDHGFHFQFSLLSF